LNGPKRLKQKEVRKTTLCLVIKGSVGHGVLREKNIQSNAKVAKRVTNEKDNRGGGGCYEYVTPTRG